MNPYYNLPPLPNDISDITNQQQATANDLRQQQNTNRIFRQIEAVPRSTNPPRLFKPTPIPPQNQAPQAILPQPPK